ncbi:DNA glycosylase AlkZ-like family protein [Niallia sp. FSL W8-1348]|uniref:DNA glycosylase AlkZ-like family protein n=1 Tax=Niallia sp. FSL W8-1348 TaxID=2954656 RepID=UPI0030FA9F2D
MNITINEARNLILYAQGFYNEFSEPIDVLNFLGTIQLDSINVLARNQELVIYSRFGNYDTDKLYKTVYDQNAFEYWGHSASWMPMSYYKLFLHRIRLLQQHGRSATTVNKQVREEYSEYYKVVMDLIKEKEFVSSSDFKEVKRSGQGWWNFKPAKRVLEDLFDQGIITVSNRDKNFNRIYCLSEKYITWHKNKTDIGIRDSVKELMWLGINRLGIATQRETADYFRCYKWSEPWKEAFEELLEEKKIEEVYIENKKTKYYLAKELFDKYSNENISTNMLHPVLISPLDNLIWDRKRVHNLFNFNYKVEFYKKVENREYGYFVLPLLSRGGIRGRADLKFDRGNNVLNVLGFWLENEGTSDEMEQALINLKTFLKADKLEYF